MRHEVRRDPAFGGAAEAGSDRDHEPLVHCAGLVIPIGSRLPPREARLA